MWQEYQTFTAQCRDKLATSSPYHSKGHGFIERYIQTIMIILIKWKKDGMSPCIDMLNLRTIPLNDNTPSPAELLDNTGYRTIFPEHTRPPYNSEVQQLSPWEETVQDMMPMPINYNSSYPRNTFGCKGYPMSNLWLPPVVISTPGKNITR